ncbi:MAG: TlpA disulfide reductase family protein [bacterium]
MNKLRLIFLIPLMYFSAYTVAANDDHDIQIYDFDEFSHWLERESDSIYIVNFWATWCAPCVKEIPDFEKLYAKYKTNKVKLLFVSLDFPNQLESRVIPFIDRMDMQAQVVMLDDTRANRWIPLVDEDWTGAIPATLIYNRDFREFYAREITFNELEEIIVPLLK